MKEVILHIGFHKTGTTSIQKALRNYRHERQRVASFTEENNSIPMYTIFSESRHEYHVHVNASRGKNDVGELRNAYLEILDGDVSDEKFDSLIISGEDMSMLTPAETKRMINYFSEKNLTVKIITYVREPLAYAASLSQERIKHGFNAATVTPGYQSKIQPFLDVLPKSQVSVYSFEDCLRENLCIVKHFSNLVDGNLIAPPKSNTSLTPLQLALIESLNHALALVAEGENLHKIRSEMVELIRKVKSKTEGNIFLEKKYFTSLLCASTKVECDWLLENYGINYSMPKVVHDDNLKDYLNGVLVQSQSEFARIFLDFGVIYEPALGVETNLLKTYYSCKGEEVEAFNPETYLLLNPDVRLANVNPRKHYFEFGLREKRRIA